MNDAPLRVLAVGNVYPPHHLGGYEVIWRGVTEALRAGGNPVRIVTTDYRNPDTPPGATDDPDVHRILRWYWHEHAWPRFSPRERLRLERFNAAVFDRQLAEFAPDVVAWWAIGGMSLGLVERVRRRGLPAVLFVLDPWPSYGPQHDLWTRMWTPRPTLGRVAERLTGLPVRSDLAAAGRWLFCSESMREETMRTGLPIDDWGVLTPGIERRYLEAPPEPTPPEWSWRLLYLGRVVEQKGVRTAIHALARLPAEATLRIVGPGDAAYRAELESLVARLGLGARVSFEPPVSRRETLEVYRMADVVLFPVEWPEPFGLVPLEAMAAERPVVATGRGGSGDFLRDGVNSLLFEAGDPDALAARVLALADDPALRRRLRAGGLETARAHDEEAFNAKAVAELRAAARRRTAG